jgi:metallophosphoesterase superfamily enzyme
MLRLSLADQTLELLPQRALFWFEQRTLVVSNPQFDARSAMPSGEVPITTASRSTAINRLTILLNFFEPERLVILGNLLAPGAESDGPLLSQLSFWRHRFPHSQFIRVAPRSGLLPAIADDLEVDEVADCFDLGPFRFQPEKAASRVFTITGSPNPQVKFVDQQEGTAVLAACFHLRGGACFALPAFQADAFGSIVAPNPGDRLFVVGPTDVRELSAGLALPQRGD